MKNKKINTNDLIAKIERITRNRIASQEVVSLDQFRVAKQKLDPKVILLIEDDEIMRSSLSRIIESDGHVLKVAADAPELAKVLDDTPIDLILIDIGLPWINGFELAELLKDHRDLKKIPLVFITGSDSMEDKKRAFELGADDYITKPFDIEKFKRSVSTLLKLQE